MYRFLQKNHRTVFYTAWFLLGLFQAAFTYLIDDEAYYWTYSRFLDWGYFDHPPMIGLLIKMGYAIFPNEIGVRLFPLLLNVFSLFLIEQLTDKKNPFLFYTIAFSIAALQLSGFIAVPDIPLIFFTALFFVCYKRFVQTWSLLHTFLLALSTVLLFYSKYHAVLIVFFTLLSNKKLFTKYQTYLAGFIVLLLFAPHLWWQYQHDWVSFRYHLFESNVDPYKPTYTIEYIIGQLLIAGPIAGFILLPAAFLYKPTSTTEKALQFTLWGVYIFFFISSFRGRIEANWTAPVLVPLMILSHQYLASHQRWSKWLLRLLPVTLVMVTAARVFMIVDILPVRAVKKMYHYWHKWPAVMKEKTKGLPVVFFSSYQQASKYWFYTGQPTFSINHYRGRKNNFNFWPIEDSLLGKPVYYVERYNPETFSDSLITGIGTMGYRYVPSYASFSRVHIATGKKKYKLGEKEKTLAMHCSFEIPQEHKKYILSHSDLQDSVIVAVFDKWKWIKDIPVSLSLREMVDSKEKTLTISPELEPGTYYLRFAIKNGFLHATHSSHKIKLVVD
ncbi:MAG TPA: glycosyltransferase family 39 protein [Chitinophagaceae bacterium]|nr:glycosyltransferase family 39 protein [Chitinophagales bacterium]HPG10050.1 glycosyltransferase family 39 protein [Chitinophagaceae bacterium]